MNALIHQLDGTEWFRSVGRRDIPEVVFVQNWLAACAGFAGSKWENIQLHALNLLGQKVLAKSQKRYNEWNAHVVELKPVLYELISRKSHAVISNEKLPPEFVGNVYADLLGAAMETEYSDLVEPCFYSNIIADCYLKGHFPCGWEGNFPEGKLVLY